MTLLRQVSDNKALVEGLQSLGIAASYFGHIQYNSDLLGTTAKVRIPDATYSLDASGGMPAAPGKKDPKTGQEGASYTYEGEKGTVSVSYTNYSQAVREAVVTVDATNDPRLAGWLGSTAVTGAGFVTRGHWTGTAWIVDE